LVLVSSLEALARDLGDADALVVPCIDAGKEQVYARFFGAASSEEWALAPADLLARIQAAAPARVVIGGNGLDRYRAIFAPLGDAALRVNAEGPSAVAVGALALAQLR